MRILAEIVQKSLVKDNKGNVLKDSSTFTLLKKVRIDSLIPFGATNTARTYGFELNTSHRAYSYETIQTNEYIRVKDKVYHVKEVLQYNRVNVLLLELV